MLVALQSIASLLISTKQDGSRLDPLPPPLLAPSNGRHLHGELCKVWIVGGGQQDLSHDQVSGKEIGAHKSFLAAAHPAFDQMFFGAEAGAAGVNMVKVSF